MNSTSLPHFGHSESDEEFTDWQFVSVEKALELIDNGTITDGITVAVILQFARKYPKPNTLWKF